MSPALAGGFLTTAPPGKSPPLFLKRSQVLILLLTHIRLIVFILMFSRFSLSLAFNILTVMSLGVDLLHLFYVDFFELFGCVDWCFFIKSGKFSSVIFLIFLFSPVPKLLSHLGNLLKLQMLWRSPYPTSVILVHGVCSYFQVKEKPTYPLWYI